MVKEILDALKLPTGYLLHKGHEVYCSGSPQLSSEYHPIGVLNPIDGTDFIAVGNPYDDKMITLDPTQAGYDPSALACKVCGATGVTL